MLLLHFFPGRRSFFNLCVCVAGSVICATTTTTTTTAAPSGAENVSIAWYDLCAIAVATMIASGGGSSGGSLFIPIFLMTLPDSSYAAFTKSCSTATVLMVSFINVLSELHGRRKYSHLKHQTKLLQNNANDPHFLNNDSDCDTNTDTDSQIIIQKNTSEAATTNIRHQIAQQPWIRYDIASEMAPMSILGACIGVRLNKMTPFFVLTSILFILLILAVRKTTKKVLKIYRERHNKPFKKPSMIPNDTGDLSSYQLLSMSSKKRHKKAREKQREYEENLRKEKENNSRETKVPWLSILLIFFCWIFTFALNALIGGDSAPSIIGVVCASQLYWVLFAVNICGLGFCYLICHFWLNASPSVEVMDEEDDGVGDDLNGVAGVERKEKKRMSYALGIAGFCAGIASGTLGTGASAIQGPFLMSHISGPNNSKTAAATSSFIALCTESTALALFIILKMVTVEDAVIFGSAAFVGAIVGKFGVWKLTKGGARKWLIPLLLSLYISIAFLLLMLVAVGKIYEDYQEGFWLEESFIGLCDTYTSDNDGFW